MANELDWLDELPDFGAEQVLENEQEHAEKAAAPAPLPIPQMAGPSPEQRREELNAFLLSGRYEDAEVQGRLQQNAELADLSANVRRLDALNARAVQGQTVLRYAYPELGQEPGAYFLKRNKPLPECQTRTDAYAAVYDDYMAEVEGEYKQLLERRAAWQRNKAVVSQAAADVVAGRVSAAQLAERLSPEQHEVYTKEFDPVATEKAGVAMGLLREAFAGTAEDGLKQMVDQGLANGVVAALSDADAESGELVLNEKAVGMFQGALFSLMQEAKEKSGEEYKFLHNMLLALGNPVKRRKKDLAELGFVGQTAERVEMLAATGQEDEAAAALEQMEETLRPLRSRWKNDAVYARVRGMLDAAQAQGNETAETADFFAKTANALGSVIGQTAPFFVPYVGTGLAFLIAYDEKRNAAYFKGLKPGTAEWSAFIDAATSVAAEKIAFGGWARFSATARILEKIPGYGNVRNTLLGSFYGRAALEVGVGVTEESALEPTAEALLQWGIRNGVLRGVDVGGRYDWAEYAGELKAMFKPEQLAATVIFGAGLSGVQTPLIKEAAAGYSKHVEHLMAQGIGKEEARNIAAMPDAGARVDAAIKARAEAWKDPAAAEANRLMAATMFREIDEARALYESRAYQEAQRELNLPKVEKILDKEGRYLVTTFDRTDGHELFHGEVAETQLLEMLGHYIQHEERMRIHRAQSAMGANALLRAAEKSGEVVVEDMADVKNPESGERVVSEAGAMGLDEFKYAAELALDELEARKASGMSEQEALATPFAPLSRYMPLGHWLNLERAFQERLATARETSGEEGADSTRVLNATPAAGTTKADTLLLAARGQVETREVLEDVIEHAQKKVTGNDPAKILAWHALLRDAQKAVKQLGFKLNFYDGHDGLDAAQLQGRITEGMSKLASAYVVVNADALPLPAWVNDLMKWHMRALEDAAAIVELAEAYKTGRERGNISQDIEEVLADIGHRTASIFQQAELAAVDVQAYKDARARYRMLTGDMTPTASEVQAEQDAADAREQERVRPAQDVKSVLPPREDGGMDEQTFSPAGDLPEAVRGAFPKGACYNIGARAWLGMVPVARLHLSPDAPQVKVGSNKKGVVNPLVGDYRQDAPPLYVWQRRNGTLEVISGRHRLDLAKRTGTEMVAAYVYPEDEQHDAKWARLLDYEQNMQDDQADELTAAIYVRETHLSDEELTRRGLTRGGTKSARGILIGREAREDLWSRFQSRAIDPRTAEAVCKLTMYMPDKSRIDAMQAMAAADLARGKSLEHVAAKLQLMAHADADGEATQGLLSFGESFDEALERSAEFIARSIEEINKHIAAVTKARSLGKGGVSEQEGISVELDLDPKQRLAELNELKAAYEKCGFHENIRFRALTWDGKSAVDPIGDYARDKAAAAELSGPTAEELEQQARDAAAEATGTFGFSTFNERRWANDVWPTRAMKKIEADWLERLDAYIAEYQAAKKNPKMKRPMGREIYVCPTPGVLSLVGVTSRDVVTTRHALDHDMFTKHGMTRKALRHLPSAIANPICIAESQSVPGALEILTTLTETVEDDKTKALVKKNVLVALHVGATSSTNRKLIVSKIASAYGKNKINTILDKHKILYWNDQKGKVMLNDYRLQLPQAVAHDLSTGNIWDFNDLVKYKQQNNFSFSVVGPSAANWDKIKHRAFKGRDDGKLRVELDASGAMFRSSSYRERVDEIKAFIEEQRELAVEDGRQRQYAELEARLDRLDEAMDSASEDEVSEILREYERIENERKDFRRKLYGEWRAVFPEIEMEEGDYLLLERAILGEKGASRTNNAVFRLASMRDNLGITPVERALHPKLEADRESIVAALKRLKESEVAQELKAVYDRTEAGERTEEIRARAEQLADDVRQEAVRLGVPERILRGKPWFRVHMELFERDAEDCADAALRTVLLEDVLDFPELYEAYPQLRDYRVYGDMLGSTAYRGMYDGWNAILLNDMLGEQEVLGTLLHEVQHAIQKIEGFAKGANTRNGMDAYMRSAGEIESRNVQLRRDWTAAEREARPFNDTLEFPGEALVAFSVTSMADAAQGLLEGSAMKVTRAQDLIRDFNAQIANWNRVAASKEGRADARTGAEMFGTVQALLSSARKVLPDGYRGNVHTLMQWASVYAGMAETGQLPAAGALKGNAKILDAFRRKMLSETAMAADNAEAEAMLAEIGEQKLNEVMVKVLQQVRGQLARFAKDELWAKMGKVIQHAKAKEEQGKKSKRGKMSAVDYEKLAKYEEYLAMDPDTVREELDGLYGKLDKAEGDRAAKLEEEAGELSLYGGWKGMSLQQAVAAYQAMVLFCATGRSSWQQLLDKRKAEIEYLAREMGRALPTDRTASETRNAEHTRLWKALRRLPYGAMSYSQLMLALSSRLGEGFCFDRIQEMTDANAALLNAEKARMGWMYELVQKVSGRKGELACEKWLADFDTQHDTGIVLSPMAWCEVEMTVEAAEDWLALGKEEREKQWAEREADEKRKKRNLRRERPMVPEVLLPELRKAVKEYKANPRKSSGKVTVRGEYEDKGRARTLTCSRDGALYAILLHEQSDYQTVFDRGQVAEAGLLYREGLNTPEKIRQLYDFVGPAGLRYGYALRERLQQQGLTVAQVFEAREGIPFKFRDNYFRASFDRLAVKEKNTVTDGKVNSMGGGKYGMLINRVAHHQEAAKWDMGASMVFLAASLEQDNYIFTSHITDHWRKLLLQREFATKLKAYLGDDVMNKLVCWLEVIDNAPLDNMRAFSNLSHWQGFFRGAWAASVLNGNGYVLMKQASALLHGYFSGYVPEAIKEQEDGVREVAHRHIGFLEFLGNAVAGGPISDKDLENSPYFQARRTAVGKGVATQGHMDAGRKRSALALPSEKLGDLIEKLDAWLNQKTARALANAFYAASKKLNEKHGGLMTEEQLREGALQAVGRMLELGAQPQTRTQKSIFQNGSGMLGKMTFAMKSESINKLGLWLAQLTRGERMSPLGLWLSAGIVASIVNYLAERLQGGDDDDEYVLKNHLVSAAVSIAAGPLSAVPLLSEGIADLSSMITGERVYSSNLSKQLWDVGGAFRGVKKLYKHHSGDKEMTWEQYFHTIIALLRISGAGFGAFSRSGSEALSSFGSLALSAAAGANVSRAGKDILCTVGLLDRPKKKGNAKSGTKKKTGQRTKRKR